LQKTEKFSALSFGPLQVSAVKEPWSRIRDGVEDHFPVGVLARDAQSVQRE